MRGLKFGKAVDKIGAEFVAPFMGAWIEIRSMSLKMDGMKLSHPLWVRGLKLIVTKI